MDAINLFSCGKTYIASHNLLCLGVCLAVRFVVLVPIEVLVQFFQQGSVIRVARPEALVIQN